MAGPDRIVDAWRRLRAWVQGTDAHDRTRELVGAGLARAVAGVVDPGSFQEVEFRVHSQFGDDGIIQWLVARLPGLPRRFIEFGVEDYTEANTRFLLVNNAWSGLVMDGSKANITRLHRRPWFWRHDLDARAHFLTCDNVDAILGEWAGDAGVGLLHIDVDGNDYWLWDAIASVTPGVVIMEYNAVFGAERPITIPYDAEFRRLRAHHSGQYFGASLAALDRLAQRKGYALVGCNSAGNNAYFVRRELLGESIRERGVAEAYVAARFRDSRDATGRLVHLDLATRADAIRGLPVENVATGQVEPF